MSNFLCRVSRETSCPLVFGCGGGGEVGKEGEEKQQHNVLLLWSAAATVAAACTPFTVSDVQRNTTEEVKERFLSSLFLQ